MEVTLVNEATMTFFNCGGQFDQFSQQHSLSGTVSSKCNIVTGTHTRQKLQSKINSLLSGLKTDAVELSCSMRIIKNKDETEDYLDVLWGSTGNHSFLFALPPQIKEVAGFQMKMEIEEETDFQKISPIYPLKNMFNRDNFSGLLMRFNDVPIGLVQQWKRLMGRVSATISLKLIIDEEFLNMHVLSIPTTNHCDSVLAKMLENENSGDTVITSASGQTVKCHRAVLVASSSYFQSMFESGMEESTKNTIDMSEMEESEIRAFLRYLYIGDVKPAIQNIQIAWKLLKAGNYYQHDNLCGVMREILMARGNGKFSVDLALDMLLFAKRMCDSGGAAGQKMDNCLDDIWSDVSLKAMLVLKWYTKEKPLELLVSEKYIQLNEETPQIARELYAKFILYADTDGIEKTGVNWLKNF